MATKRHSTRAQAKRPTQKIRPQLTEIEESLLQQMEHGYQLETSTLEGVVLRRLKDNEVIRPASANMSTVNALEGRGLIRPAKGHDPLATIWRIVGR